MKRNLSLLLVFVLASMCCACNPATVPQGAASTVPERPVSVAPEAPQADDGPVVLTIGGDGVSEVTEWSLGRLQSLREGYRETLFSTTNNWPTFSHMEAHGVSIPYLLGQAGYGAGDGGLRGQSALRRGRARLHRG